MTASTDQQLANAQSDRARYENIYQPVEDQFVSTAQTGTRRRVRSSRRRRPRRMWRPSSTRSARRHWARWSAPAWTDQTRFGALDLGTRCPRPRRWRRPVRSRGARPRRSGLSLQGEAINIGKGYPGQVSNPYGARPGGPGGDHIGAEHQPDLRRPDRHRQSVGGYVEPGDGGRRRHRRLAGPVRHRGERCQRAAVRLHHGGDRLTRRRRDRCRGAEDSRYEPCSIKTSSPAPRSRRSRRGWTTPGVSSARDRRRTCVHVDPLHGAETAHHLGGHSLRGFGEVARLMKAERPDLAFILVNDDHYQLGRAPEQFQHWLADMKSLPIAEADVDGAMFLYSLCHADRSRRCSPRRRGW